MASISLRQVVKRYGTGPKANPVIHHRAAPAEADVDVGTKHSGLLGTGMDRRVARI